MIRNNRKIANAQLMKLFIWAKNELFGQEDFQKYLLT
jgi:hypothetical protein